MCFSASASYSSAAVLIVTGAYALQQTRRFRSPYWLFALAPLLFGVQQAFEGRVWQMVEMGDGVSAVSYALGFHFFSHFLWLWWFPISSYMIEPERLRKRLFLAVALFGALAGAVVYFSLLLNPGWMTVEVEMNHIVYDVDVPFRGPFSVGIPPSALYGLIILLPLLLSSFRHVRIFGGLVGISIVIASLAYGYAFVSVWCFFAALLSLYLVYMARRHGARALPLSDA